MISFKKKNRRIRISLYFGLIINIILGLAAAVTVYTVSTVFSNYYINNDYLSTENSQRRREEYLDSLQHFVDARELTFEDAERIAEWAREHKYVYLLVHKDDQLLYPSDVETDDEDEEEDGEDEEDNTDKGNGEIGVELPDISGGLNDNRPSREELIAAAQANGLHEIEMSDGTLMVSLTEFTHNLYQDLSKWASLLTAALVLAIFLINYFRIIIKRISKLESDVNIVSHEDMNYEIVSRGNDEIADLSKNVEIMRNTMLENLKNEQEAREANTELITSISHDLRTPLTVLMGYVEMMKNHQGNDDEMVKYISATESTAQRLKQLSDDMFRYALVFGDAKKSIIKEEYDAKTLFDQLLSEHVLLMEEQGYTFNITNSYDSLPDGTTVLTDAQNLMRIIDNIFSNLHKYADTEHPIELTYEVNGDTVTLVCRNKMCRNTENAESNGIGLKTCVRLASYIAEKFEYQNDGDSFTCRLSMQVNFSTPDKK